VGVFAPRSVWVALSNMERPSNVARANTKSPFPLAALWISGIVLVIAGVVALIEEHSNRVEYQCQAAIKACEHGEGLRLLPGRLSERSEHLLSTAGWVLLTVGATLFLTGLVLTCRRLARD
jgi:uncharacterized protein YjeT (DUF2065 family)